MSSDEDIAKLLEKDSRLKKYGWDTQYVSGHTSYKNPFLAQEILNISKDLKIEDDQIIKLFTEDCDKLEIAHSTGSPIEYNPNRKIIFKSELSQDFDPIKPSEEIVYNAASSFFIGEESTVGKDQIFHTCDLQPKKTQVFNIELVEFKSSVEFIEPITCSAFLFSDSKIISEVWHFVPSQSLPFFEKLSIKQKIQPNHKAAFQYSSMSKMVYLVILFNRCLQVNNGDPCDKYYFQNNAKNSKAAKESFESVFERHSDIFSTFAWTFVPATDLMTNKGGLEITKPYQISQIPSEAELSSMISDEKNIKSKQFPFILTFNSKIDNILHITDLKADGFSVYYTTLPQPTEPQTHFKHRLVMKIIDTKFKFPSDIKGTNIFAEVTFQNGFKSFDLLPIIEDKYRNGKVDRIRTICHYHVKNPLFNEIIVFDLPDKLQPNACIVIEYFHATAKKDVKPSFVGASFLPLFESPNVLIHEGIHELNITYGSQSPVSPSNNPTNQTTISIQVQSSMISTNQYMNTFLKCGKEELFCSEPIKNIDSTTLIQNLFSITEILVTHMSKSPKEVIEALDLITQIAQPAYPTIDQFFIGFGTCFALRNPETVKPEFHRALLDGWSQVIDSQLDRSGAQRFDVFYCDFLFILLLKSIYLTKDHNINTEFIKFAKSFSNSVNPLAQKGGIQARKFSKSYADFLNVLFDIGLYTNVVEAIQIYITSFGDDPNDHKAMTYFVEQVFRPKFFVIAVFHLPSMQQLLISLVSKIKGRIDSRPLQSIFGILLKIFSYLDDEISKAVTSNIITSLTPLNPLSQIPFTESNEIHESLIYFVFIISHIEPASFKSWWENTTEKQFLYDSLHFLLDKLRISSLKTSDYSQKKLDSITETYARQRAGTSNSRAELLKLKQQSKKGSISGPSQSKDIDNRRKYEIVYSTQFGVLHLLNILASQDKENFGELTKIVYHLMCSNISIDFIKPLITLLNRLITERTEEMFLKSNPILTKITMKILDLSSFDSYCLTFLDNLFIADNKQYKNNNRAFAVCARAFSLTSVKCLQNVSHVKLQPIIHQLTSIQNALTSSLVDDETIADMLYQKSCVLSDSPDARLECLQNLVEFHKAQEYYAEEIQTLMLKSALILEYLTCLGKINTAIFEIEHPAEIFLPLCSSASTAICPPNLCKDLPRIPSYCDSPLFNEANLIDILLYTVNRCRETGYFETGISLIDIIWPLFENRRAFEALKPTIITEAKMFKMIAEIPNDTDRMFGRYFRVSFYGTIFGDKNKSVYIYHEKKLTHLFEVTDRIIATHKSIYGDDKIELIKESGDIDVSHHNPDIGYIQVTFVAPFHGKNDTVRRITEYEQSFGIQQFSCDTPFVPGSKKLQGSVNEQWLRRTVLQAKEAMPTILKRQKVQPQNIKTYDIEPIRVSYRALRERIQVMSSAIERHDYKAVQQLLHGSLLVQVNEGPSVMAEVFLTGDKETKYTKKLQDAFRDFLKTNEEGLKLHATWVSQNTDFIPLQHELESGFTSLSEKLASYF